MLRQDFVVMGGGIAGLAAAREILKQGHSVTVFEQGPQVGGLARTFERDGFRFDLGGHRFHSNNPSVVQWLKDLLGNDLLVVPRFSHIHIEGQFVEYPIRFPGALSIFTPPKAAYMVMSYLFAKWTERNREEVSFEDWVVKRYGRGLYDVFFRPYTEKVWGIKCTELSAHWAAQRIGIPSMWRAIRDAISPNKQPLPTAISEFYYPRAGFGMIPEALAKDIVARGGTILTSTGLAQCIPTADGFDVVVKNADGSTTLLQAKDVVSTLPLNVLLKSIPNELGSQEILERYDLEYRDIICLFVALNKRQVSKDSWTYFPAEELVFGRTHEPKNWSSEMVPDDRFTSLAIEIFASRGQPTWESADETILDRVVEQMNAIGWINKQDVYKSWVLRVPNAYPVYRSGYRAKLEHVRDYLGQWSNLHLVGRTGSFRYMNSDGVIEDVFDWIGRRFPKGSSNVEAMPVEEGRWV